MPKKVSKAKLKQSTEGLREDSADELVTNLDDNTGPNIAQDSTRTDDYFGDNISTVDPRTQQLHVNMNDFKKFFQSNLKKDQNKITKKLEKLKTNVLKEQIIPEKDFDEITREIEKLFKISIKRKNPFDDVKRMFRLLCIELNKANIDDNEKIAIVKLFNSYEAIFSSYEEQQLEYKDKVVLTHVENTLEKSELEKLKQALNKNELKKLKKALKNRELSKNKMKVIETQDKILIDAIKQFNTFIEKKHEPVDTKYLDNIQKIRSKIQDTQENFRGILKNIEKEKKVENVPKLHFIDVKINEIQEKSQLLSNVEDASVALSSKSKKK